MTHESSTTLLLTSSDISSVVIEHVVVRVVFYSSKLHVWRSLQDWRNESVPGGNIPDLKLEGTVCAVRWRHISLLVYPYPSPPSPMMPMPGLQSSIFRATHAPCAISRELLGACPGWSGYEGGRPSHPVPSRAVPCSRSSPAGRSVNTRRSRAACCSYAGVCFFRVAPGRTDGQR